MRVDFKSIIRISTFQRRNIYKSLIHPHKMHHNFFLKLVYADIIGAFLIGCCFISLSFQCNYLKYFVKKKKWLGKFPLALEGFRCRKRASHCSIML
jgi:hypothetical protein